MRGAGQVYLALSAALVGLYCLTLTADQQYANALAYTAVSVLSTAAVLVGLAHHRPSKRATWVCIAAAQGLWAIGNASYLGLLPLPTTDTVTNSDALTHALANALYLAGYALLVAAMWQMMFHRCAGARLASSLDGTMLAVGLTLTAWVLLARPALSGPVPASPDTLLGLGFVLLDLTMVSSAWAVLTTPGARTPAFWLLISALGLQLAGDTSYVTTTLTDALGAHAAEVLWVASTALWGAAALHPSMRALTTPGSTDETGLTSSRLLVLLLAALVGPLAAYLEAGRAAGITRDPVVLVASILLVTLTVARMALALRTTVGLLRTTEQLRDGMAHQATHDSLTGLANRAAMHTRLTELLDEARCVTDPTAAGKDADAAMEASGPGSLLTSPTPAGATADLSGGGVRQSPLSKIPVQASPLTAGPTPAQTSVQIVETPAQTSAGHVHKDMPADVRADGHVDARSDAGGGIGLLLIDLDGFKHINDTLGHAAGDAALQEVAHRLRTHIRPGDCAARLGGDEFVILLRAIGSPEHLLEVAQRLLAAICAPASWQGHPLGIAASIGAAHSPDGTTTSPALLAEADAAVYRAKNDGKARVQVFDDVARAAARARSEVENSLRQVLATPASVAAGRAAGDLADSAALEFHHGMGRTPQHGTGHGTGQGTEPVRSDTAGDANADADAVDHNTDHGCLEMHYQPVVDLDTGEQHGVEALIRWRRADGSLRPPDSFIPIAEESELICEVGRWVLLSACTQLAAWAKDPGREHWQVAVNISARHLKHPTVLSDVTAALALTGARPTQLTVEVTESVLVDSPAVMEHLRQLRELGVAVAIDDFGTGYTSIGQLQHLPADYLKIDRSLVASTEARAADLVRLVVRAAHAFGLVVIAEGIEDAGQHLALLAAGAQLGQGWLFGRPAPVQALPVIPV